MGQRHFNHLQNSPLAERFSIVDPTPLADDFIQMHPKIRLYSDTAQALAEEGPKWAIVAVSTTAHHRVALPLVKAGIHVLIEKPITPTEAEALELIKEAAKTGAKVFVGHSERFNPAVVAMRTFLQSNPLGAIHSLSLSRWGAAPGKIDPGNNVVLDLTVHDIDIIHSLGLSLSNIQSILSNSNSGGENYVDHSEVVARVAGGESGTNKCADKGIATLSTSWKSPERLRLVRVLCDKGILEADLLTQKLNWSGDESLKAPEISKQFPIELQLAAFMDSLAGKPSDICTAEQGLEALLVARKILQG